MILSSQSFLPLPPHIPLLTPTNTTFLTQSNGSDLQRSIGLSLEPANSRTKTKIGEAGMVKFGFKSRSKGHSGRLALGNFRPSSMRKQWSSVGLAVVCLAFRSTIGNSPLAGGWSWMVGCVSGCAPPLSVGRWQFCSENLE